MSNPLLSLLTKAIPYFEYVRTLETTLCKLIQLSKPVYGLYKVLDYKAELELSDPEGHFAIYQKYERVQFLQNSIRAYEDQAWGDGEIFASYRCSPGSAVDFYPEGNLYRVLISLRETKHRGDVEDFHIERHIRGGFHGDVEYFQNRMSHKTSQFTASIIFPIQRPPTRIVFIEESTGHSREASGKEIQRLPDQRQKVTWFKATPRTHETYTIKWEW